MTTNDLIEALNDLKTRLLKRGAGDARRITNDVAEDWGIRYQLLERELERNTGFKPAEYPRRPTHKVDHLVRQMLALECMKAVDPQTLQAAFQRAVNRYNELNILSGRGAALDLRRNRDFGLLLRSPDSSPTSTPEYIYVDYSKDWIGSGLSFRSYIIETIQISNSRPIEFRFDGGEARSKFRWMFQTFGARTIPYSWTVDGPFDWRE